MDRQRYEDEMKHPKINMKRKKKKKKKKNEEQKKKNLAGC